MKWKFVALVALAYPALIFAEEMLIDSLGKRWQPNYSQIIVFVRSIPGRENLEAFDPYCRKLDGFLWYVGQICAEATIITDDCERPPVTVTYLKPKTFLFQRLFSNEKWYYMANELLAVVSNDLQICDR